MLAPGYYSAIATDGSGETILIRVVGSRIPTRTFGAPPASIQGLSEVFTSDGRPMTQADEGENCFKIVGQMRAFKVTGSA